MSRQYGISALVSQTSFREETSGGVVKCPLFSQAIIRTALTSSTGYNCRPLLNNVKDKIFLHTLGRNL